MEWNLLSSFLHLVPHVSGVSKMYTTWETVAVLECGHDLAFILEVRHG